MRLITPQKASQKDIIASQKSLGASQKAIIEMVSSNPKVTTTQMAESLGIDRRNIQANIKKLQEFGLIRHEGGRKDGKWVESLLWGLLV